MLDLAALLLSGVAVFLGAALQGGTGTGLALVATPIVQLLRPGLMPGAMLVVAFGLALLAVADEAGHADWSGLRWALGGRLLGTACSAWAVAVTTAKGLSLISGAVILVVAAMAALAPAWLPRNRLTLVGSGVFAGVAGTTVALGGPLIALVYRRSPAATMRGSLGVFTTFGSLLSLVCLGMVGVLSWGQITGGLALLPFVGAGFLVASRVRDRLRPDSVRGAVLVMAVLAAAWLILRSVAG
ncbi:TSUP family transporter [Streptosporangiaceae bacterium NEAU-GS5]|nr:TSUP family transporter [Streptosporangiaceae bacterium NEAU-GS5]